MRLKWMMLLLCLLVASGCTEPTIYGRVIIDTYNPTEGPSPADTYLSLYDSDGGLIVEDNDGNPNVSHINYARIDYTEGLRAGTYYVKVSGDTGPYGIRALFGPDENYTLWLFTLEGINVSDAPYEPDDTAPGNVPTNPATLAIGLGGQLNRYLALPTGSDVDWFVLTLPE